MLKQQMNRVLRILFWDWGTLLLFEIIYNLLGIGLVFPLLKLLLSNTMHRSSILFVSHENFMALLSNPVSIGLLLLILLIFSLYIYLEIMVMLLYCEKAAKRETVKLVPLIAVAFQRSVKSICHYQSILLLFFIMIVIPFAIVPFTSSFYSKISVPEFITEAIFSNPALTAAWIFGLIAFNVVIFFGFFTFHEMVNKKMTFLAAYRSSFRLVKKSFFPLLLRFLCVFSISVIAVALIAVICILIMLGYAYLFFEGNKEAEVFTYLYINFYSTLILWMPILLLTFNFIYISVVYTQICPDTALESCNLKRSRKRRVWNLLKGIAAVGLVLFFGILSETVAYYVGMNSIQNKIEIIAHRGSGVFAPENTVASIKKSIDMGFQYAEIDVQQLKDGTLILLHDSNFKRTTGVKMNVSDALYDEVKHYDAGSYISPEFKGEPVPTLEQAIAAAGKKIKLMLELKKDGKEEGLVDAVLTLIDQYGLLSSCSIASLHLDLLREVKAKNPLIETVYITPIFFLDHQVLPEVDAYSVEATFVSPELIAKLHLQDKEIYAWTINHEEAMQKIFMLPIDGVITDHMPLAQKTLDNRGKNMILEGLLELFFPASKTFTISSEALP